VVGGRPALSLFQKKRAATKKHKIAATTDPTPPPRSPDLVPYAVTKGKINIAHAPPSSPVCAHDSPVANLFCDFQEVTQNKRPSTPREKSGHTPARKKHGRTTHRASSVKGQGVIPELLSAKLFSLHVDDSLHGVAESSEVHRMIVTPDGDDSDDGMNESDDDNYHPPSNAPPPSSRPPPPRNQKKTEPKITLDCSFMKNICSSIFDHQQFQKGQLQLYTNDEIASFDNNFRKQLHFNFSATRMSQKQLECSAATRATRLHDIDLDLIPKDMSITTTNRHKLFRYILEDLLDCPVGSRFIVCIATDAEDLERGEYYSNTAQTIANEICRAKGDCEYWTMYGQCYFV
jgi:hypothetical protein